MGGAPKPKTEKERYFEEQQKRLRQFHRPGAQVTDANTLVENLFSKTGKPGPGHGHGPGAGSNQQTGSHHAPASSATIDGEWQTHLCSLGTLRPPLGSVVLTFIILYYTESTLLCQSQCSDEGRLMYTYIEGSESVGTILMAQ